MPRPKNSKPLVSGPQRGSDRAYRTYLIRFLKDGEHWVHKGGVNLGTFKTHAQAKAMIDYLID